MLSFREDRFDDVVYVNNLHDGTWLEEERDREPYTQTFTTLAENALSANKSLELIADAVTSCRARAHL